jgi:hypothetical protein
MRGRRLRIRKQARESRNTDLVTSAIFMRYSMRTE